MKGFLGWWLSTTIGVLAAAHVVTGIHYEGWGALLAASLVLGLINALLRPILMALALPLILLTFGLFTLVINSALFYLVGKLVHNFHVAGWWSAFWGSVVVSVVSILIRWVKPDPPVAKGDPEEKAPQKSSDRDRIIDV